jgi:hypothetical protein
MGLDEGIRTSEDTIFPRLAKEGAIRLYVTQHRQRLHFRVSGEDSVYTEEYHEAGNPGDRRGYWYEESRPIASLFRRRFQAILAAGIARPAKRDDFVFLPMETIRKNRAAGRGQAQFHDRRGAGRHRGLALLKPRHRESGIGATLRGRPGSGPADPHLL